MIRTKNERDAKAVMQVVMGCVSAMGEMAQAKSWSGKAIVFGVAGAFKRLCDIMKTDAAKVLAAVSLVEPDEQTIAEDSSS